MNVGWSSRRLESLCEFFNDGNWIESKDQSDSGYRLIQTGNVGIGEFRNKSGKERFVSEETFKKLKCTEIFPGDTLISRLPDPVGRTCILPPLNERMITAVDCTIVRFKKNVMISDYFRYYSQSVSYFQDVSKKITGTTRDRISRSNLGSIEITFPEDLAEQQRIVSILDEAFAAIDKAKANIEKNISNARELFQSELNAVFSQMGEGWVEKRLNEISENLDSKRIPITKSLREPGEYPYYGASGIVDYVKNYIFDDNLLLVSEDGANLLARTYPIAFSISGKTWVNNHAHILKFQSLITQSFVEFYLNSIRLNPFVSGMAQPKLNQAMLNKIPIPYPNLELQEKIVMKLNTLSTNVRQLEFLYRNKLDQLDILRKSILHKAFNGELTKGIVADEALQEKTTLSK